MNKGLGFSCYVRPKAKAGAAQLYHYLPFPQQQPMLADTVKQVLSPTL